MIQENTQQKIKHLSFEIAKTAAPFLEDQSLVEELHRIEILFDKPRAEREHMIQRLMRKIDGIQSNDKYFVFGLVCLLQEDMLEASSASIFEICYFLRNFPTV